MEKVDLDVSKRKKKLLEKYVEWEGYYRPPEGIIVGDVLKGRYEEAPLLEEDYFDKLRQRESIRKELERKFVTRGDFEKYKSSLVSDWSDWTEMTLKVCKKVSQDTAQITLKEQKISERVAALEKYIAVQEFPDILFRTLALGGCGMSIAGIILAITTRMLILIPTFLVAATFCYYTYRRIGRTR